MEEVFNPFTLKGKTILVTGASSGIGKAIAVSCSKMGATVYINGRNIERLHETLALIKGNESQMLSGDITISDDIAWIVENSPMLDGIVHCAEIGFRKLCRQIEEEDIKYVINSNFEGPVKLQTLLLKKKKINKAASIVFISSIAYSYPWIGNSLYSASKGALVSYSKCLSIELANRLIRVNCISPGMVWTDLIYGGGLTKEDLEEDEKKYPLKRYGTPEDIANSTIFLLSDASSWITGICLTVAGGIV